MPVPLGRDPELASVRAALADERAVVVAGEPGIGKSTVWRASADAARTAGMHVLTAGPASAERGLAFVALGDLLGAADLDGLAPPQRRALEVALLRADPGDAPPDPRGVGLACVALLAAHERLLIAIDDVQWLDAESAEVIAFAARRLPGTRFLLARRPGPSGPLEDAVAPRRIVLGPLSYGAVRALLADRLGLALPRRVLREVVAYAGGNPLFALELARGLAAGGMPGPGEQLALPETLEGVIGARVAQLPPAVRRLLLAVALEPGLRVAQALELVPAEALEDPAVDVAGDRVRAAHPLLAAAALGRSAPAERRALHQRLAALVRDPGRRARHRARAATTADPALAAELADAACVAAARGARADAATLADDALRLTPAGAPERPERLLALAQRIDQTGDSRRMVALLEPELSGLPPAWRARAHLLLADGSGISHADEHFAHLDAAAEAAEGEPALQAQVAARRAAAVAVGLVERLAEMEASVEAVLPAALAAGGETEAEVFQALAWTRALRGRSVDDLLARPGAPALLDIYRSVERVAAVRLIWRGEIDAARAAIGALEELAETRGETWSTICLRLHRCELEVRAGEWLRAEELLREWADDPETALVLGPALERLRALVAAGRGDPGAAERWVAETLAGAERSGVRWDALEAARASGVAALVEGDPGRAVAELTAVAAHLERAGCREPGAFPIAAELGEALAETGERAAAEALAAAHPAGHPWGGLTARRTRALLTGDDGALREVAAGYAALGLRADAARTRLKAGTVARRRRAWAAAREDLEAAAAAFDAQDAAGWAALARGELERVGARRPRPAGELTPAEARVVALAAEGASNKEIAAALHVTVNTVEGHLTRAFGKLGVRSRSQLAARR